MEVKFNENDENKNAAPDYEEVLNEWEAISTLASVKVEMWSMAQKQSFPLNKLQVRPSKYLLVLHAHLSTLLQNSGWQSGWSSEIRS